MALAPGTRIGSYEIVALVGAGGMGEVYRARDARLGREVAVKILPAGADADPDRLHRFEEARAAAALNHPNILTVHEIGTHDSTPYVVAELLAGSTLRDMLAEAPKGLPVRRAIELTVQLATGLGAAHDRGIVHRDIKPENIFVTRDGRVKILDFGLAKLVEGEGAGPGVAGSMLATHAGNTAAGVVLGTIGYMSPEQLRGQPLDARGDIFSFGAVVYEMLSGTRAFEGATPADTISAILTAEPADLASPDGSIPAALDRIVRHCLEKTPALRFQSARDIVFNLELFLASSAIGSTAAIVPAAQPRRARPWLPVAVAVAAIGAAIAAVLWRNGPPARVRPVFQQVTFRHGELDNARFATGGQDIVYTAAWEGQPPEIYMVPANQSGGRPLGIRDARLLAVSKSGELAVSRALARLTPFAVSGTLARGSILGGAPKDEIEDVLAADYAPDGKSLAIVRVVRAERRTQVEYPVGTVLYRGSLQSDLRFSSDGKYLAFIDHESPADDRGNAVILRATGEKVAAGPVRGSQRGLAWNPANDEVWTTSPLENGRIFALAIDGSSRDLLSVPGRLYLRDVSPSGRVLLDQGTSRRGIIVASDDGESQRDVSWLDYSLLRGLSKDGKTIVFDEQGSAVESYRTFVRNLDAPAAIEVGLGFGGGISDDEAWTLSVRLVEGGNELWLQPVGAGEARRVSPPGWTAGVSGRFFADGKRVAYAAREPNRRSRIYVQRLDGSAPRAITGELDILVAPLVAISPDERWVASAMPGGAGASLAPVDGGATLPVQGIQPGDQIRDWSADGQLYVASGPPSALRIDKVNPFNGKRTFWRDLRIPPVVGLRTSAPFITPDGRTYAYNYMVGSSNLFTLSGVR
jgi:eukaryotic-like serine/threonine-protein kinase